MKFTLLVSLWHDRLHLQATQEDQDAIERLFGGAHFEAQAGPDGRSILIRLARSWDGQRFHKASPPHRGDFARAMDFRGTFAVDSIARFRAHEVQFSFGKDPDGYVLAASLEADYKTPWPLLKQEDCQAYYTPDEMVRQIMLRRRHALEAGETRMDGIPDTWLAYLDQHHKTDIFNQSRAIKARMDEARIA